MKNAKRFNDWITIGAVPDKEDIIQLKEVGFKTLIDVRDEEEKFGGYVERNSIALGLNYINIPIYREEIKNSDVIKFFEIVYEQSERPIYCFSRFGKRPLAFLLVFNALAQHEPVITIIKKSRKFGMNLEGDLTLQNFIINTLNSPHVDEIIKKINEHPNDFILEAKGKQKPKTEPDLGLKKADREKLQGARGFTIWFTGIPASGKTTLAAAIEVELFERGYHTYLLDGDNVRLGLSKDLGFSLEDRKENIRRVSEVARLSCESGIITFAAFISPYQTDREAARQRIGKENFIEVFVDCPLAVCEARDPKGIYKKARQGEIKNFTGIDAPYEAPKHPEIHLYTDKMSVNECVLKILEHLLKNKFIMH